MPKYLIIITFSEFRAKIDIKSSFQRRFYLVLRPQNLKFKSNPMVHTPDEFVTFTLAAKISYFRLNKMLCPWFNHRLSRFQEYTQEN